MPVELQNWVGGSELPSLPDLTKPMFADIVFKVDDVRFRCHRVFFCGELFITYGKLGNDCCALITGRSYFFKAMLADHFLEHEETGDLPVYTLRNVNCDTFKVLMTYVYQDQAEFSLDNVFDLLMLSDVYLLPGLKKQAANYVGANLDTDSVINVIRTARLFELARLETDCCEFIASNLELMVRRNDFEELIREDAESVKGRQETDSIDIVDEIRFYITNNVQTYSAMEEANEKLALIDALLENLGLDA